MIALPVVDSHASPLRVMAVHAPAYCQRLFYLEEVEELRVADAATTSAGRSSPDRLGERSPSQLPSCSAAQEMIC